MATSRVTIMLDAEHAAKLKRLAVRTFIREEILARSLLSQALDDADPEARHVAELLDGIPGALERAQCGLNQASSGKSNPIDEL